MNIPTKDTQIKTGSKRNILVKMTLMCLTLLLGCREPVFAAGESDRAADYLERAGMLAQEIEAMDGDARQFIASDLKNSGQKGWEINRDILTWTKISSEQYNIAFYINVFAFQAGTEHRIYAVYESSTGIMPEGNDSLFLGVGDGFAPREYGGRIWYKRAGDGNWTQGGELAADGRVTGGGMFAGGQLGDFRQKMLVKGCVYCHADAGTGSDRRVTVEYTYHPPKERSEAGLYILTVVVTVIIVLILRKE